MFMFQSPAARAARLMHSARLDELFEARAESIAQSRIAKRRPRHGETKVPRAAPMPAKNTRDAR